MMNHPSYRRFLSATLVAGSLFGLSACDALMSSEDSYTILAVLPFSGKFEARGEKHKTAILAGLLELEDNGIEGKLDKPLNVEFISSGQDKDTVTAEVEDAFSKKTYAAVFSSTGTAHKASLKAAISNETPHFEMSSGADYWEFFTDAPDDAYDPSYSFSTRAMCFPEAVLTARFLDEKYAGQAVVLLRGSKEHDEMHTQTIRQELHRLRDADPTGAHVILADEEGMDVGLQPGEAGWLEAVNDTAWLDTIPTEDEAGPYALRYDSGDDFSAPLQKMVADYAPAAFFYHLRGDKPNLNLLKQAVALEGFDGEILTCGMSKSNQIIDYAESDNRTVDFDQRVFFVSREPIGIGDPDSFFSTWTADFNSTWSPVKADTWTPGVFDATVLIGLGLVASGGELGPALRDAIRAVATPDGSRFNTNELGSALSALSEGTDIDYSGPSGPLDFNDANRVVGDYNVQYVSKDGPEDGVGSYVNVEGWGRGDEPCNNKYSDECFVSTIQFDFK